MRHQKKVRNYPILEFEKISILRIILIILEVSKIKPKTLISTHQVYAWQQPLINQSPCN
jgi:hypothetical protein